MNFSELIGTINPETHENLKTAVELGKWPDGRRLSKEQQALCLQAIIAYEKEHLPEHHRTGFIEPKKHEACDSAEPNRHSNQSSSQQANQEQTIKWQK